jgi:hypothetical protein
MHRTQTKGLKNMQHVVIDTVGGDIVSTRASKRAARHEARDLNRWQGTRGRYVADSLPAGAIVRNDDTEGHCDPRGIT